MEQLSGVQAHTLRIWEKRYNLFSPQREGNNVRCYTLEDAQKLLNISTLYHLGYKISFIASLSDARLLEAVQKETLGKSADTPYLQAFKQAMLTFDERLFEQTYSQLKAHKSLSDIFPVFFLPLLQEAGQLWQTETISVAHEHFISNLVRQKIMEEILSLPKPERMDRSEAYVLFLPSQEIHELSLLYAHYEILRHGRTSVFLGQSVPMHSLEVLHGHFERIHFVTHLTLEPIDTPLESYLGAFAKKVLRPGVDDLWISGRKISLDKKAPVFEGVHFLKSPADLIRLVQQAP